MIRAERGVVTDGSYRPGYCLSNWYHNAGFAFVRFRVISCLTYDPGSWSPRNSDHTHASKHIYIFCRVANEHLAGGTIWPPLLLAGWKIVFWGCAGAAAGLWRIAAVRRDAAAGLRQNSVACDGVLWCPVASARIGWGGAVAAVAELKMQQRAVAGCNEL
jgi:hypothetical protein